MPFKKHQILEIKRAIIFSKTPLLGYFRFDNVFQIYSPILEGMPFTEYQRDCPLVLEYAITPEDKIKSPFEFENFGIHSSIAATEILKEEQIVSLLTLLTNHFFFRYKDFNGCWGIAMTDELLKEKDFGTSTWNMKMYTYPQRAKQGKIDDFTTLTMEHCPVRSHIDYYLKQPSFDNGETSEITIPNSITDCLKAYYQLNTEERKVVNTAIKHINLAFENYLKANVTLASICSFTAIESMVHFEYKDFKPEVCDNCGQQQYKVAKKYRDFLLEYIGDTTANKRKFNKFYSLRSKIIHTGELFETENLWNDIPKDKQDKENLQIIEILQLSKLSVINWLLKRKK